MDSERIEALLNKYWNCETSLEDEQELQTYFTQSQIPEHLKDTAAFFGYFDEEKKKSLDNSSFEKELIHRIQVPKKGKIASLMFNSMRIAAGIIALVLAVWLVRMEVRKSTPVETADTYNDPKMAFEETKKALMMISRSFGTAEQQAKKINLFNEAQQDLRKGENESEL
jgi:hypothetical protein